MTRSIPFLISGTDHGHANAMFVLGNSVRGGEVYGAWPGLKSSQLYEGRDLALNTDIREVFSEIAQKHLGASRFEKRSFPVMPVERQSFVAW